MKVEANRNPELQKSLKELKEKAEELKVAKIELKNRTKQTTEQLYKHVDSAWTEAEATAKKLVGQVLWTVLENMKCLWYSSISMKYANEL
ncbi:mitochondrial import inner membrane translocase subunit TIM44-2-like isoform X1 [Castanea sativa]|uniref:mitochondrial import inner membrane translocase subunit TIM44-2-like isoform X1 n=1 Tax=Castanea sativa TaxID=21020 RepID=UPI003F64E71A